MTLELKFWKIFREDAYCFLRVVRVVFECRQVVNWGTTHGARNGTRRANTFAKCLSAGVMKNMTARDKDFAISVVDCIQADGARLGDEFRGFRDEL